MFAASFDDPTNRAPVKTVPQVGWASIKNGKLLRLAEAEFDVFMTADRNLSFQQNFSGLNIAVIILAAPSNRYQSLLPLMPKVFSVLVSVQRGQVVMVGV